MSKGDRSRDKGRNREGRKNEEILVLHFSADRKTHCRSKRGVFKQKATNEESEAFTEVNPASVTEIA